MQGRVVLLKSAYFDLILGLLELLVAETLDLLNLVDVDRFGALVVRGSCCLLGASILTLTPA